MKDQPKLLRIIITEVGLLSVLIVCLSGFGPSVRAAEVCYDFNDAQVPEGTFIPTIPVGGTPNPGLGVTNAGGYTNSGCLILSRPSSGETWGQWWATNVISQPAASFTARFKLWMGNGTGGNMPVPNPGGNGVIFHVGPLPPAQYSGGASQWGNGLDVTFRTYNSGDHTYGINVSFDRKTSFSPGAGTYIAKTNWAGYWDTNGVTDAFTNHVDVELTVNNGVLTLVVGNERIGTNIIFENIVLPGFRPLWDWVSNCPPVFGFSCTDGAGAHEDAWVDNVCISAEAATGPIGFSLQPTNVIAPENVFVTFEVGVTGAPPYYFQWYSNNVPIADATSSTYTTPLTLYAMDGTQYYVVASNYWDGIWYSATSDVVTLSIIRDTVGIQALSVGSLNGNSVGVLFSGYVDEATAANPANYRINGVTPTAAVVRTAHANYGNPVVNYAPSYLKTVQLTPASPVSGTFTVTISSNVLSRTGLPVPETNLVGSVLGMSTLDLGVSELNDPYAIGEAFSGGPGMVELVGGGQNFLPIDAYRLYDAGRFAYNTSPRNGNFDVVTKVTFLTLTANSAKAGLCVRPNPTDAYSQAIAVEVFPPAPGNNTYQTAARTNYGDGCYSWAAPGAPANGNLTAFWGAGGNWLRLRSVAGTYYGYGSADGQNWTLIGQVTPDWDFVFPRSSAYLGLFVTANNNDGRLCEANFENWGMLVYPTAVVSFTNNLRSAYTNSENGYQTFTVLATFSGTNLPASEITYQWQKKGPGESSFSDILGIGNTNSYTTPMLTVAGDNGSQYRVIAYVGDLASGRCITSTVATLYVVLDTEPPYMVSAAADETFMRVKVRFDGAMEYGSVADQNNYTITGPGGTNVAIASVEPINDSDWNVRSVILHLQSPIVSLVQYNLSVRNVRDLGGNNINNTTVPGGKDRTFTGWALAYGFLKYERWLGPSYPSGGGPYYSDVSHLLDDPRFPDYPDVVQLISYSGYPNGDISNPTVNIFDFGARISGFFIPSATANYQWYVRGNDGTALWVSTDSSRENRVLKAAANVGFTSPGMSWLYSITNPPVVGGVFGDTNAMSMTQGQLYYIEAIDQQANGTSFIEFTYGTDPTGQTVKGGISVTNTPGGAYPVAGRGGAPTNSYNITGNEIAVYVNPDLSGITAVGPTNISVEDKKVGIFSVSATALVGVDSAQATVEPILYQWYSNGVAIASATNPTYVTPPVTYPSPVVTYSVVMSVPGLAWLTKTNSATLTVTPDVTPPVVVTSYGFGGNVIALRFDGLMDPASTTNKANYTSGLNIANVRLLNDNMTVLVTLSNKVSDFTLQISGVKDAALNPIVTTNVVGSMAYPSLNYIDIGVGEQVMPPGVIQTNEFYTNLTFNVNLPGAAYMLGPGTIEVLASGQGFGSNAFVGGVMSNSFQDGLNFVYEQKSGDFDVKVRVDRIDASNARAKAGLMMRAGLEPGSVQYMIAVEPAAVAAADGSGTGYNGVTVLRRQTNEWAVTTWGNNPQPPVLGSGKTNMYPIWLRMRRTGPNLYVYTGADGTNWYLCGRAGGVITPTYGWSNTVYIGMATAAGNKDRYTQAQFSQYGDHVDPAVPQALFVVGNGVNVEAGAPNAPQQTSDQLAYRDLINMGFQVTATHGQTAREEDGEGKSLIVISSTITSGDMLTPNRFTAVPVPLLTWEGGTFGKLRLATSDSTSLGGQTAINITNTAPPVASALTIGYNGPVTMLKSGQNMLYVAKTAVPTDAVIIAQPAGGTTPDQRTVFFAYEAGATMAWGTNIAPARRVAWGIGENDGRANYTDAGFQLFTNALRWAAAGAEGTAPTIWTQPANQVVRPGVPAYFIVTAVGGSGPYTYQWQKVTPDSTNNISAATNRSLVIPAPAEADEAGYRVIVTAVNSGLSVTSAVATLTLQRPAIVTSFGPLAPNVAPGETVAFSVTVTNNATNGNTIVTYNWYCVSGGVTNLVATHSGVMIADGYITPALWETNSGDQYYVVASTPAGGSVSPIATVTVGAVPMVLSMPAIYQETNLVLTWTGGGVLQTATNVAGPFIDVPGATSPFTNPITPGERERYFRVRR